MLEKLKLLSLHSQSKYYSFPVSCILECKDGHLFEGVNVETSSPAAGICAERNALFQALAQGYQKEDFVSIHIYSKSKNNITPCFICRQALLEYVPKTIQIISYTDDGKTKTFSLDELCTYPFQEEDLQ